MCICSCELTRFKKMPQILALHASLNFPSYGQIDSRLAGFLRTAFARTQFCRRKTFAVVLTCLSRDDDDSADGKRDRAFFGNSYILPRDSNRWCAAGTQYVRRRTNAADDEGAKLKLLRPCSTDGLDGRKHRRMHAPPDGYYYNRIGRRRHWSGPPRSTAAVTARRPRPQQMPARVRVRRRGQKNRGGKLRKFVFRI